MARTAPVPDIPPIPGMCPSVAVLAGGGDGGGGSGDSAGDGSGDNNAGGSGSGAGAEGDQRGAPDYNKYPKCGYASHPVDVVTGRAFTHPILDLALPGPLPLSFKRMYSSKASTRDMGLGPGWAHSFGWEIEVQRRRITVWNEQGIAVDFPVIPVGGETLGPWGWVLRRETWGFAVDADDGVWHLFSAGDEAGKKFKLTAIQDRNKNRIALTYEDNRLVEIVDSAGRIIRAESTREGRIASLQVKSALTEGHWIAFATYGYDDHGRLASATDADGFTARYAYDEDNRLTEDADRAGLTFHFRYDIEGRCIESWGDYPGARDPSLAPDLPKYLQDGVTRVKGIHHCKFEYFAEGYSEVADSTQVRRYFGTIHGTLSKAVEGGGAVMTASYRDDGHLLAQTDALGATTSFDRDARGRIVKVTDPLGRTSMIARDAAGLVIEVIDPAGGATLAMRDRSGNLLTLTDAAGATSSCTYDTRGLLTSATDAVGARTTYEHDAQGDLVALTQANGGVFRYTYDGLGRMISETDPLGAVTRFVYTARGDLAAVHDAVGSVVAYSYDGEAHVTQVVERNRTATQMIWGGYHKLCLRQGPSGTVALQYNTEGELIQVVNERDEVYRYEYSTGGLLIGETTFDGRVLRYRLDAMGRRIEIKNGELERTKLTYDLAGQLVEREYVDGAVETFEYNPRGEIVCATSPVGSFRFDRDAMGRILRETQEVGDDQQSVALDLDAAGGVVARATSLGHRATYTRDAVGFAQRWILDGEEVNRQGDLLGREIVRAFGEGTGLLESVFDVMGRVTARRVRAPATTRAVDAGEPEWIGRREDGVTAEKLFRYDADGDLVESWDRFEGSTRFGYDPAGRLLERAPEKGPVEAFRYDATGNLHEVGAHAQPREHGAGNKLLRRGDTEYVWDADGRLAEKRTGVDLRWKYTWNGAGLLGSVEAPDGTLVELAYDPFVRRVQKRVSRSLRPGAPRVLASVTRFVWDGDVLIHEVRREGGSSATTGKTYVFEEDGFIPAAQRDLGPAGTTAGAGPWLHYANDTIGTPERLLNVDGRIEAEIDRTAWGDELDAKVVRAWTPLLFQGQYEDAETGLAYNRYRYYDAEVGRYLSPDPVGLQGSINAYLYALNPVVWVDPLGLDWNYRLRTPGGVYYHGRASDNQTQAQVIARHTKSGRYVPGTSALEQVTPRYTNPNVVRGCEERAIAGGNGGPATTLNGGTSNRISGVSATNPNRTTYLNAADAHIATQTHPNGQTVKHAGSLQALPWT